MDERISVQVEDRRIDKLIVGVWIDMEGRMCGWMSG